MRERLGPEIAGFQPQDYEILAAFALFSTKGFPQDESFFAKGLKTACEAAPFLSRFIDESGGLSEDAKKSLEKLQEEVLTTQDGVFIIDPGQTGKITSCTRTYFKEKGMQDLKTAAQTAQEVWFSTQ